MDYFTTKLVNAALVNAACRLAFHRKHGPCHEINYAIEDIIISIIGLGFSEDERPPKARFPGLIPGQTFVEAAKERMGYLQMEKNK